ALLVAHQDVLDVLLLEKLVVNRQHRPAGIAEDVLDAMIDQRPHDHGCAGHLVRIVALVAHGFLRMRWSARLVRFVLRKIKRGPRGPMHTARMWMALAIPGGAPGYDGDKEVGNFITHIAARTSQRLRGYSRPTPEVKGGGTWRDLGRLTGF